MFTGIATISAWLVIDPLAGTAQEKGRASDRSLAMLGELPISCERDSNDAFYSESQSVLAAEPKPTAEEAIASLLRVTIRDQAYDAQGFREASPGESEVKARPGEIRTYEYTVNGAAEAVIDVTATKDGEWTAHELTMCEGRSRRAP